MARLHLLAAAAVLGCASAFVAPGRSVALSRRTAPKAGPFDDPDAFVAPSPPPISSTLIHSAAMPIMRRLMEPVDRTGGGAVASVTIYRSVRAASSEVEKHRREQFSTRSNRTEPGDGLTCNFR